MTVPISVRGVSSWRGILGSKHWHLPIPGPFLPASPVACCGRGLCRLFPLWRALCPFPWRLFPPTAACYTLYSTTMVSWHYYKRSTHLVLTYPLGFTSACPWELRAVFPNDRPKTFSPLWLTLYFFFVSSILCQNLWLPPLPPQTSSVDSSFQCRINSSLSISLCCQLSGSRSDRLTYYRNLLISLSSALTLD